MKQRLSKALKQAAVDYCEVRVEETHQLSIDFQGQGLDRIQKEVKHGGNARALCGGGWGFAAFDNLEDLPEMVRSACSQARSAADRHERQSKLAPVPVVEDYFVPTYTLDPRAVSVDEKVRLLTHYNDLILGFSEAVAAARIVYRESSSRLHFANTEGTYVEQEKVDIGSSLTAIARRGDMTATESIGLGSSVGYDCMLGADERLEEACAVAVRLLDAPQVKSGSYPVVTDYALTELLIHEAFGHLSEADNAYKNPELAETMSLGRRLGRDILTIYDTGEYEEHRGFLKYDDEGVRTQRTVLVEDGILVGRLHSRETAGLMGEEPTGSARALDYTYPPIVRMRSTCVEPGESTFEDMIADIEHGIYAVGSSGGQTNAEMFNFNAGHGYMIRDGETAELVRDVRLMGNVFTALKNIDMIGDTPRGWNSAGGCGKDGQAPLPTGGVNPRLRMQNVIIGGDA